MSNRSLFRLLPWIVIIWLSVVTCCNAREASQYSASSRGNLLCRSGDAYVRQSGTTWVFGTSKVEQEVVLKNGHLLLTKFINTATHRNYVEGPSDEIRLGVNGEIVTGGSTFWTFDKVLTETLSQGQLLLRIILHDNNIQVQKTYIIYPEESIIEQWLQIRNISTHSITITNPFFLQEHIMQTQASQLDFSYMTGGMCFHGSWMLKTSSMTPTFSRHFDASDPAECVASKPCPKGWLLGNSIYAPIYIFFNRKKRDGIFVGWSYLGRWGSYIGDYNGGQVNIGLEVSGYKKVLSPGSSVITPRAFTGVFIRNLDNMGNQLLDYQYRYKWHYTRSQYFPAVRMLGYWWKGATDWPPGSSKPVETTSTFRKIFRTVDLMRSVGADIYWRDYGWWNLAGDWNGPDFQAATMYLAKYGMPMTIYLPSYDAEQGSKVVTWHSDWLVPKGNDFAGEYYLNQAIPGVIGFELKLLDRRIRRWGNFEWRIDDLPVRAVNGDDTPMLAQSENFVSLIKQFLNQNPGAAFHGCNDGGNGLDYEMLSLASVWQYTDGCVGKIKDYYTSYLFPPDKLEPQPDRWNPNDYEKSKWRGLLWSSFAMTGDTFNPSKLEGIRRLIAIYHYLAKEGVVGRWVKIYHPKVEGDQRQRYLQRMSRDNLRGIIIPSHTPKTPVTIYPRGLLPATTYNVSFQESKETFNRLGANLMAHGITLSHMSDGELIYLNLPMHPGSAADTIPPSVPGQVYKEVETNMGVIGVALHWIPATDNNWVSYYEIYRNGKPIGKVAKGTYYFDHSAGAILGSRYGVQAVDGSGNKSAIVTAKGSSEKNAIVIDDSDPQVRYVGSGWKHEKNVWDVYRGTQSFSSKPGDSVVLQFTGNRVTWYGRYGPNLGRANVYIDGRLDRTVDCYDADNIPNMPLYSRTFPESGTHTLRIVILHNHNWESKGTSIYIDGFQIGQENLRVVESPPADRIRYSGSGWIHDGGWKRATGGFLSWSGKAGTSAEYSFRGNSITWVSRLCPSCGMADVYIDGTLDAIVDTYEPDPIRHRWINQGGWQAPVYERSWPQSGKHTIRIVVRKDNDNSSSGHNIFIDSFEIGQGN